MKRPTALLAEVVDGLDDEPMNDQQPPEAELVPWIDAFALAIAASVRAGQRGLAPTRDAEVMDVGEVATFLGVDRKTVYDYAGRGEIPCRRLGKRILFSRSALVAWLGSCKVASRANGE